MSRVSDLSASGPNLGCGLGGGNAVWSRPGIASRIVSIVEVTKWVVEVVD